MRILIRKQLVTVVAVGLCLAVMVLAVIFLILLPEQSVSSNQAFWLLSLIILINCLVAMLILWNHRAVNQRIADLKYVNTQIKKENTFYFARLASLIENPRSASIFSIDRQYRYTGFNELHVKEMHDIFNFDVVEGKNILDAIPDVLLEGAKSNFDRALKGEHFMAQAKFEEKYFTQIYNPIKNENKEVIGITGNFIDVTQKVLAERELDKYKTNLEKLVDERTSQFETQKTFFQTIIDLLPNMIFLRDIDHRYILINRATADSLGTTVQEMIGKTIRETHSDLEEAKIFEQEDLEVIKNNKIFEQEAIHINPEGVKKSLYLSKRRLLIDDQTFVLGVYFDISFLKKTEKDLQQTNAELVKTLGQLKSAQQRLIDTEKMASIGQLTAGLAHEINNPLNYLAGNLNPMRRDLDELKLIVDTMVSAEMPVYDEVNMLFSELNALFQGMEEGTSRVKSLMVDLSEFSSPDPAAKRKTDINHTIQQTINLMQYLLKDQIVIKLDLGDIPDISCNPRQIGQVFFNLIKNSVQAISSKGEILLKTYRQNSWLCVEVHDTGIGIPDSNLNKIFDPFFTSKDVGEGTGLGLFITYNIIKEHGGSIEVVAHDPGNTILLMKMPIVESA